MIRDAQANNLSEDRAVGKKHIFVLLDSNAWIGTGFMRSFEGKTLVDFLSQTESKLIFPEIAEGEVRQRYISDFRSSVHKVDIELKN